MLTGSEAAHICRSTDAVLFTERRGGHRKSGAWVAPRKRGMTVRRFLSLFDIVILMKGHVGGGPGSNGFKALVTRLN